MSKLLLFSSIPNPVPISSVLCDIYPPSLLLYFLQLSVISLLYIPIASPFFLTCFVAANRWIRPITGPSLLIFWFYLGFSWYVNQVWLFFSALTSFGQSLGIVSYARMVLGYHQPMPSVFELDL